MIPFTRKELNRMLVYERDSGKLYWGIQPAQAVRVGADAGSLHPQGYIMVQVQRKIYAAHRLIWKMVYGVEPDTVDHINGDKSDNR